MNASRFPVQKKKKSAGGVWSVKNPAPQSFYAREKPPVFMTTASLHFFFLRPMATQSAGRSVEWPNTDHYINSHFCMRVKNRGLDNPPFIDISISEHCQICSVHHIQYHKIQWVELSICGIRNLKKINKKKSRQFRFRTSTCLCTTLILIPHFLTLLPASRQTGFASRPSTTSGTTMTGTSATTTSTRRMPTNSKLRYTFRYVAGFKQYVHVYSGWIRLIEFG